MNLKALIEDLELNHEHCPKEVILKAAAELRRLHDLLGKANALCRIRAQERNFCARCGKRLGSVDDVHTCTPPREEK